jgi:hypothetical protein
MTLLAVCTIATIANHIFYPMADVGSMFTRAFLFIGFSRLVLHTSQQISEASNKKREQESQNHEDQRIQEGANYADSWS